MSKLTLITALAATAAAFTLTACGGGASPFGAQPPVEVQCTRTGPVTVALFGDSTMVLTGARLQTYLDGRFGVGVAAVSIYAVGGTTAEQLPAQVAAAAAGQPGGYDVGVVNSAINDARAGTAVAEFTVAMQAMLAHVTLLETPSPIDPALGDDSAYAAADRMLGAQAGVGVIDTQAYVLGMQGWLGLLADGVHPAAALEDLIVTNSRGPAVGDQVEVVLDKAGCGQ